MADACCRLSLELAEDALALDVADAALEWGEGEYVRVVSAAAGEWPGPYEATPALADQTLATAGLLMARDLTVRGIPSYRTTNQSGGYTVVIAQD